MVDFTPILSLKPKWEAFQRNGSVDLSHTEKQLVQKVFKEIYGFTFCNHCPTEVIGGFTKVFLRLQENEQV